jgi:ureidoglycolate hydrolase
MGVTYKTNTWHHPLLVTKNQDFWVIDRINNFEKNNENLEEFYFDEKDYVYIDLNV